MAASRAEQKKGAGKAGNASSAATVARLPHCREVCGRPQQRRRGTDADGEKRGYHSVATPRAEMGRRGVERETGLVLVLVCSVLA